jgi:hypothetical protein
MGILGALVLFALAVAALRTEDVRWSFTIPLALIPALFAIFASFFGILIGAMLVAAYWKLRLP